MVNRPGDVAIGVPDEAIEEALSDHHLDEVVEMIERMHTQKPAPESPFSGIPAGYIQGSS